MFVVHMWGSKNYKRSVLLKYDCRVADVVSIPSKIDIKFCFINYVYDRKIILKNTSKLPCRFKFTPFEDEEEGLKIVFFKDHAVCIQKNDGLMIEVAILQNAIPPLEEVEILLKIQTPELGLQEMSLQ